MAFNCKECGEVEEANYSHRDVLIAANLCFYCHFWTGYVIRVADAACVRVKGCHYVVGSASTSITSRGYGGNKFVIHFNDGRVVESNNLWCQGDIPERFKKLLPDNAAFLNSDDRGKATEKAPEIVAMLEGVSGVSRDEAICATCHSAISMDSFRDEKSRREFRISRMCQTCQDSVFEEATW